MTACSSSWAWATRQRGYGANSCDSKVLPIDDDPNIDTGVMSMAISPNVRFVTAGSLNTIVRIWDVATGMLLDHLRRHSDSIYLVTFTPDGPGVQLA